MTPRKGNNQKKELTAEMVQEELFEKLEATESRLHAKVERLIALVQLDVNSA